MRLQVFLSRNGVCSRRRALEMVKEGRVTLNGQVCREPSTPVEPGRDHVSVEGKKIKGQAYDYILLNKPAGYITTKSDRFADKTVLDLLPAKFKHLAPVGRLDRDTEGLLLLTNDGDAAYQLTHPKFNLDKVYFVCSSGRLALEHKKKLEGGVVLDGRKTAPAVIKNVRLLKDRTEFTMTVHEGRKRQIRRMLAAVGYKVVFLKRLAQGPLTLGILQTGAWRTLNQKEIGTLKGSTEDRRPKTEDRRLRNYDNN
jgi:pseudouridine synthase